MLVGEYAHALDDKGRLTIPARFRPEFAAGLFLTRGYEPCLAAYPLNRWMALAERAANLPVTNRTARAYSRWVFGGAFEATLDRMGRILVPGFLREYAGIEEEAILVGVNTHVEVWNPERWRQLLERDTEHLDEMLDEANKMGL